MLEQYFLSAGRRELIYVLHSKTAFTNYQSAISISTSLAPYAEINLLRATSKTTSVRADLQELNTINEMKVCLSERQSVWAFVGLFLSMARSHL